MQSSSTATIDAPNASEEKKPLFQFPNPPNIGNIFETPRQIARDFTPAPLKIEGSGPF